MILDKPKHCKDCHEDYSDTKHVFSCKTKDIQCDKCNSPKKLLEQKIRERIKTEGSVTPVEGVFGDASPNRGFIEDTVLDKKGIQTKFFGCSFLFKGDLDPITHDSVTLTKRVLIESVFLVLKKPFIYLVPLLLPFRKLAIRGIVKWLSRIYEADLKKKSLQFNHLSPLPRELLRAGNSMANKIRHKVYRNEIKSVFYIFAMIIQSDLAYHTRIQDPLSNLNKDSLEKNPRKEILRIFDLAISRELIIKNKIQPLRKFASLMLIIPFIRRFVIEYFTSFDLNKIKPDRADRYFAYRRKGYNFDGLSYNDRMKIVEKIDEKEGNIIYE